MALLANPFKFRIIFVVVMLLFNHKILVALSPYRFGVFPENKLLILRHPALDEDIVRVLCIYSQL